MKELNYKIYLESVKKTVFSSLSMRMITAAFTKCVTLKGELMEMRQLITLRYERDRGKATEQLV